MLKKVLFLVLFLTFSFSSECKHLDYGTPTADQVICRDAYTVGYSYKWKVPSWVSYNLDNKLVSKSLERENRFFEDTSIPLKYRSKLNDYKKSGFDRGHLMPNASADYSKKAQKETFYLSNIAPQYPNFNRKGWGDLEQLVRDWLKSRKELYVISGSYAKNTIHKIGNNVVVPTHFYKIIYNPKTQEIIAFLIPHKQKLNKSELRAYLASVDEIESLTGLDFFKNINDKLENKIESFKAKKLW